MKCPYRKNKTKAWAGGVGSDGPGVVEEFAECYGTECPYYKPEVVVGRLTTPAACGRVLFEELNAKKETRTYGI